MSKSRISSVLEILKQNHPVWKNSFELIPHFQLSLFLFYLELNMKILKSLIFLSRSLKRSEKFGHLGYMVLQNYGHFHQELIFSKIGPIKQLEHMGFHRLFLKKGFSFLGIWFPDQTEIMEVEVQKVCIIFKLREFCLRIQNYARLNRVKIFYLMHKKVT